MGGEPDPGVVPPPPPWCRPPWCRMWGGLWVVTGLLLIVSGATTDTVHVAEKEESGQNGEVVIDSRAVFVPSGNCDADYDMCSRIRLPQTVGDRILTLPETTTRGKRVIVIGDVHGCHDELTSLLRKSNALKSDTLSNGLRDDVIVIFVGDLVNKGPKSMEVLEFAMHTERVYSVLGNHEVLWAGKYKRSSQEVDDYLKTLPYIITVPEHNALVVHAGFIPGLPLPEQSPDNIVHMRNVIAKDGWMEAYSETDKGEHWAKVWDGTEHVYYGHDARRGQDQFGRPRVQRFPGATGLDTRCVKGGTLTGVVLPVEKEEFYSVPSLAVYSDS